MNFIFLDIPLLTNCHSLQQRQYLIFPVSEKNNLLNPLLWWHKTPFFYIFILGNAIQETVMSRELHVFTFNTFESTAVKLPSFCIVRPKIWAFVPRRKNCATQWTSPADATRKRVYCRLCKPGDSDLLGGRAHRKQIGQAFMGKNPTLSAYYIRVTKWLFTCLQSNSIGTTLRAFVQT